MFSAEVLGFLLQNLVGFVRQACGLLRKKRDAEIIHSFGVLR